MKINNKLLDEQLFREKSSIALYLKNNYTYTSSSDTKLTLAEATKKGNNLSLYNGGVKIGAGISHVVVSGQVYYYTGSEHKDGKFCNIYLNNSSYSSTSTRLSYNYVKVVSGVVIIPVKEGDVIYLYARNDTSNETVISNGKGNTFLSVIEL